MGLIFCGGHPGQILRRLERRDPDVLEDLPIPEDYMALRVFGDVRLMSYQDDSDLRPLVEFLKDVHDLQARPGVQVTRGFIGQDQRRPVYQRARDGHPLLLPPGELAGVMMFPALETYVDQGLQGFSPPFAGWRATTRQTLPEYARAK